jgi:glutamyl/glutaminyl-tRNA synthetase
VVRFRLPDADTVTVEDAVRGTVVFPITDLDDFVLLRGDGRATYNLAVVVDDVGQQITHVIRGAGHLSNTHKQALLFDALGRARPVFAHLPTVMGPDGHPLSKRQRSQSVEHLRGEGYHPDGVVNYLSLLGWSSPDGREVFTRDELVERTSLDRLGTTDATALDPEKLLWMSGQHVAAMELGDLVAAVRPWLGESSLPPASVPATVAALRSRLHRFGEIGQHLGLIHPSGAALDQARTELRGDPAVKPVLSAVRSRLAAAASWDAARLGEAVRAAGKDVGAGGPKLFHPVRQALTASNSGPDLGQVLVALGREEALARLSAALAEV